MPSGRATVNEGWRGLPAEVRTGILGTRDGSGPNRRARKPLLRRLFPDYSIGVLDSPTNHLEQHYDPTVIIDGIIGKAAWIAGCAEFVSAVKAELGRRGCSVDDPLFTQGINVFDGTMAPEQVDVVCHAITGDPTAPAKSIRGLDAYLSDPARLTELEARLDAVWKQRSATLPDRESASSYDARLDSYLRGVGFSGSTSPTVDADARAAWAGAVDADAPWVLLRFPDRFGLSTSEPVVRPQLVGGRPSPTISVTPDAPDDESVLALPLDQPIKRRLWSVLKGAAGKPWLSTLPAVDQLVDLEIRTSAKPLGLNTADARAALSAGVRAYSSIDPELVAPATADARKAADDLSGYPGAIGYLNRYLRRALILSGGWSGLHPDDQDDLLNSSQSLVPRLWIGLHNAEFRPGLVTDPAWVWGKISGAVHTVMRDIQQRRLGRTRGAISPPVGDNHDASPLDVLPAEDISTEDTETRTMLERDLRVTTTMRWIRLTRGEEFLKELLETRDTTARAAWETAAEDAFTDRNVALDRPAAWRDLVDYLSDNFPASTRSDVPGSVTYHGVAGAGQTNERGT